MNEIFSKTFNKYIAKKATNLVLLDPSVVS